MKNKLLVLAFLIPAIALASWVLVLSHERSSWDEVKVVIKGYDPSGLLSGHYIQSVIDWEKTDINQFGQYQSYEDDFGTESKWGRQCRYYIPEQYADRLQRIFLARSSDNTLFEVIYAYRPGHPAIAKKLLINGKDWMSFIGKDPDSSGKALLKYIDW